MLEGAQPRHSPTYRTSWQLWRRAEHPDALAHLALRTKSPVALDALALAATDGTLVAEQVVRAPAATSAARSAQAAALALALAGMSRSEAELAAAAELYEELWAREAFPVLPKIHHQGFGQALFLSGRHAALREVLGGLTKLPGGIRHDLETDLANPHLTGDPVAPADHEAWVELLSRRFVDDGFEPLTVEGHREHLFDRLGVPRAMRGRAGSGPLVSVIMPCYRPDEGLLTSISSISNQTWGDLEILVVDDASGPEHEDLFAAAVASDERARLVRMERNGGSYLGRNAALEQARGEFITFQDADDWSHPRRLEQQVALLTDQPQAPASRSLAVRAKDDLTHQWFGYASVRDNASSLMLRRSVIEQIGPFAALRKGADSEYAERVTSRIGPVSDTGTPLAITRLRTGTLSRGDFTYQWSTPERLVFKGSYRAWHRRLADAEGAEGGSARAGDGPVRGAQGSARPDVGPVLGPENQLLAPVPRSFLRGLPGAPTWASVPLAFLGDLSADPTATGALEEAGARLWRELDSLPPGPSAPLPRVGLWHLESPNPLRRKRPEMHDAWFDRMVASGDQIVPLTRLEPVRVDHLVVTDPRVLLLAGAQPVRLEVAAIEIRLSPEALTPDRSGLGLDLLAVSDVCRAAWGLSPRWVPAPGLDETARAELEELLPGLVTDASAEPVTA